MADIEILFEVSDERRFQRYYGELASSIREQGIEVTVSEDAVAYGMTEIVTVGLIFVFQASLSGLTWDVIKQSIRPFLGLLTERRRKKDEFLVYIQDREERVEIVLPSDLSEVDIEIPEKLRLRVKK